MSTDNAPAFCLGSHELTGWARPRGCHVLGAVSGPARADFFLVRLEPPGPAGDEVIIGPRFTGDRLRPEPGRPIVVNVFTAPPGAAPGSSLAVAELELVGRGELYVSEAEAAPGDILGSP